MDDMELIGKASLEELKRGYVQDEERFVCLFCGETFEKGVIYSDGGDVV